MTDSQIHSTIDAMAKRIVNDTINRQLTARTTDATPQVVISFLTTDNEAGIIDFQAVGIADDGVSAVTVRRIFRYVNNASTVAIGTQQDILPLQTEVTGATVTASVNVFNIEIAVKGAAATSVTWVVDYKQILITTISGT